MKHNFKIGQLVTPTVKGEGYKLGNHERIVGKYYEIVEISEISKRIRLSEDENRPGSWGGWLNFDDVSIKKENYNYLIPLLEKHNII